MQDSLYSQLPFFEFEAAHNTAGSLEALISSKMFATRKIGPVHIIAE